MLEITPASSSSDFVTQREQGRRSRRGDCCLRWRPLKYGLSFSEDEVSFIDLYTKCIYVFSPRVPAVTVCL